MMQLVWLKRAIQDRDAQLDYIAQDNPLAAVSQGDHIEAQIDLTAKSQTPDFQTLFAQKPNKKRPG